MPAGITDQIRRAAQKQNRIAAVVGASLGGFVPLATYRLAHAEVDLRTLLGRVALGLVVAGLVYSASTVYGWALIAFRHRAKALGFVVLLEGTMTLSSTPWLAVAALVILTVINALSTACNLADDQREARAEARTTKATRYLNINEQRAANALRVVRSRKPRTAAKTSKRKAAGK